MDFWRTKKFKELEALWNEKLKEEGFEDAEIGLRGERTLKQRSTNSYRQANILERELRLGYFLLMGQLANETKFPTDLERIVMHMHAEGSTIKEIVEALKFQGLPRERKNIGYVIRRWQMKWGVKSWSPKELKLKKTPTK